MGGIATCLDQKVRDSCHGSLARSVFTVSHHLAKESPRNDGRMKDASKETLVLAEDLAEQFFGEQLRKTFDWKSTKDALQLEGALAP
jgi:hypothetical protein